MIQIVSVTERGQITIPARIRKLLGISRGEKMILRRDDDRLSLRPVRQTIDVMKLFGSIDPKGKTTDPEKAIREAKRLKAIENMQSLFNNHG